MSQLYSNLKLPTVLQNLHLSSPGVWGSELELKEFQGWNS